jgi:hypothetical protein
MEERKNKQEKERERGRSRGLDFAFAELIEAVIRRATGIVVQHPPVLHVERKLSHLLNPDFPHYQLTLYRAFSIVN